MLNLKDRNMYLSPFERKCLSLNIGYDHDVCDGKYCERKMTCVRYMLHKRAEILQDNTAPLPYIFGKQKYKYSECYKKYE